MEITISLADEEVGGWCVHRCNVPDCFVILFFDGPGGGFGCPNCEEAGEELLDGLTS